MVSVMYHCLCCVALSMDLFVLRVCELFGETIRNMFGCVDTTSRFFLPNKSITFVQQRFAVYYRG